MKKIGFIGLGKMGLSMAKNLCKAGFEVYVCSSNADSESQVIELGGKHIESFAKMATDCDAIITIVPADKEILDLYTNENGIFANAKNGLYCIDMTSAQGLTKESIASCALDYNKNLHFIDAPVSGGVAGAANGTLTIMVGSTDEEFAKCTPIFDAMGKKIVHTGVVGSGSHVKMLNQMLNAANTAIAAEVLCLSRKLGVEDSVLSEVVNMSSGASFVFEKNVPKFMMTGDHTPGFRLNLMKKDVGLFHDTATSLGAFTPVSDLVYQIYKATANQGNGDMNYTYIHKWYEENQ